MQISIGQIVQALVIAALIGIATFIINLNEQVIVNTLRMQYLENEVKNCVSNDIYQVEKLQNRLK